MKYGFALLIVFLPALAYSQQKGTRPNEPVYKRAGEVVDSFIHSTLGIKNEGMDLNAYNQFKSWFDINAVVQDDYNAVYQYDIKEGKGKYIINRDPKPFDMYAHDVALQVKNMAIESVGKIQIVDSGKLIYRVFRKVSVLKERKYVLPVGFADSLIKSRPEIAYDEGKDYDAVIKALKAKIAENATYRFTTMDTLTISLIVNNDNTVKIIEVSNQGGLDSNLCQNDFDQDAVLDENDRMMDHSGDFTADGRPDYDFDGVPDKLEENPPVGVVKDQCTKRIGKAGNQGCPMDYFLTKRSFDGFAGLQMNSANINLPELNQLGYVDNAGNNAMDVNQSKKGSLKNPGFRPGIHTGANFSYYFGRKERKLGISFGAAFSAFFADYQLTDSVIMYTFKANDSQHDYRRRVTIDSLSESIRYSIFNFPVLFSFRSYFGKKDSDESKQRKSVINIKAGPSFMVFSTNSEYDAFVSFEGLYQTGNNGISYENFFDPNSDKNVFFTADKIHTQNPGRSVEDVFKELRAANQNYDFADSKNYRGKQKNESRLTVGFNLDINLQRQISTEWAFKLGLQALYAPLPEKKNKYIPINKTTDPYNSIYNSSAKSSYNAFGLNVGLVYNF